MNDSRAEPPYAALARVYNDLMDHVDYTAWASHVERLIENAQAPRGHWIEVAAGTGRMAQALEDRGRLQAFVSDLRPAMVRQMPSGLPRTVCDYQSLPLRNESVSVVLCLYDAANYCLTTTDLVGLFAEARRVLLPGGVLVADFTTSANARKFWNGSCDHFLAPDGTTVVRESTWDGATRLQTTWFAVFEPQSDGRFNRRIEVHHQRIWTLPQLHRAAARSGLEVVSATEGFGTAPAGPRDLRWHLVLARPFAKTPSKP